MRYLALLQVLEGAGWALSNSIEELKGHWCIKRKIFDVGNMSEEKLKSIKTPKLPFIENKYKLIYEGR